VSEAVDYVPAGREPGLTKNIWCGCLCLDTLVLNENSDVFCCIRWHIYII